MNPDETHGKESGPIAFLPFILLSLAIAVLVTYQITADFRQRADLQAALDQQQPEVAQARQMQKQLTKIASDLLDLASVDMDARAIVQHYGIKRAQN